MMGNQAWIKHEMESLHRRLSLLVSEHKALRMRYDQLKEENERLKSEQEENTHTRHEVNASARNAMQLTAWQPNQETTSGGDKEVLVREQRRVLDEHIAWLSKCINYLESNVSSSSNSPFVS